MSRSKRLPSVANSWVHRAGYSAVLRLLLLAAFVSLLLAGSPTPVHAATTITFTAPELLGTPTDTSVTINFVAPTLSTPASYQYYYGTTSGSYSGNTPISPMTSGKPNETTITGLTPNTRYYYRMQYRTEGELEWVPRPEYSFWTQRAKGSAFTFTLTSDGHGQTTPAHKATWSKIRTDDPDFDIDLGDAFVLNGMTSQNAVNQKILDLRGPDYIGAVAGSVPILLASGNHENEEGWNLDDTPFSIAVASIQARKSYFPTPVNGEFYTGNSDPLAAIDETTYGDELREDYYAWEWGDALFVVIDPFQYTMNLPYTPTANEGADDTKTGDQWSWTLGGQQFNWLKQTLENSTSRYKFVLSHQMVGGIPRDVDGGEAGYVRGGAEAAPYFEWGGKNANGTEGFASHRDPAVFGTKPIHQLMLDNRVTAYFHGHDHQFAYEERDDIVYQEVPSAGLPVIGWTFPNVYTEGSHDGYRTIKEIPNAGYLRVTITGAEATVTYVCATSLYGCSTYTYTAPPRPAALTTAASPAEGGSTAPGAGTHEYSYGASVTVTASPSSGYVFDHWSGDCTGSETCEVTMNTNKSVTAVFTPIEYTIAVDITGAGAVTQSPDQVTYHYGDEVELLAVPDDGWQFSEWSGDLTGTNNPEDVTITGDLHATATFVAAGPETTIDIRPDERTNSTSANFSFHSSVDGSTFECQLDGETWATCTSPQVYADLADGSHTFEVFAIDPAARRDLTPAAFTWTVDTADPETAIDTHPDELTNTADAAFKFSSTELGSTFQCRLDDDPWTPCTSPQAYADLADGSHTFEVFATDLAGNPDLSPAAFTWSIDATPPDTSIDSRPDDFTNSTAANFAFSAEPNATFQCRLDGEPWVTCTSPQDYAGLSDGGHTFEVFATDPVGNPDPSPASFTWSIDTTPLALTTLTLRQSLDKAAWSPLAGDLAAGYTVALDPAHDWYYLDVAALTANHTLADGDYGFTLDQTGLPAGWLAYWANKGVTATASEPWQQQMWRIVNGEAPIFFLRVDASASMLVDGLGLQLGQPADFLRVNGDYPLAAYAYSGNLTDIMGGTVAVTAHMTFIDAFPPETAIDSRPDDLTNSRAAGFEFSSTKANATFQCRLDGEPWVTCTSPQHYADLADGSHTFEVFATDPVGNPDPSPASFTWSIDTTPLALTALTLRQSLDKAAWSPLAGDLAAGYTVALDPAHDWYYLDVAALTANHTLAAGDYGFTLDQAALPAGWLAYWANKGVTATASEPWQQQMWRIVNGEAPIFFLRVDASASMLVDGLGLQLGQPADFLRVNGDYPLAAYTYSGNLTDVMGGTVAVTAHMTFIGPYAPAAPIVTAAFARPNFQLTWPAVSTDAAGSFTTITTYRVFRSDAPYFTPGPENQVAEGLDLLFTELTPTGAGSYFYTVQAENILGASAGSNRTGVFTMNLIAGSTR